MSDTVRVLIVDDHPVVRRGLRGMLRGHDTVQIVGEAGDGVEALSLVSSLHPDVVLLDIRMPGQTGTQLTARMKLMAPTMKVIILTTYEDDEYLFGAFSAGADGYLLKTCSDEEIVAAFGAVIAGERVVPRQLMTRVLGRFEALSKDRVRSEAGLSDQEIQMVQAMARGATNKEIADILCWSEVTAKRRAKEIYRKLGVADRTQAVAEAIRRGLI